MVRLLARVIGMKAPDLRRLTGKECLTISAPWGWGTDNRDIRLG
jgi:hypothetical protein